MQYKLLDIAKFLMALVVVSIHSKSMVGVPFCDTMTWFSQLAVPFFFAASGFLLEHKIMKQKERQVVQAIYSSYIKKSIKHYLLWMLIYLPLTVVAAYFSTQGILHNVALYVRGVVFVGETAYSWPLWYLLALIVAVCIIRILHKWHISLPVICLIGLGLMGFAWGYENADSAQFSGVTYYMDRAYRLVFATTRNGIFVGLACVSLGMIAAHFPKMKLWWLVPFILIAVSFALYKYNLPYSFALGGLGIMLLSILPPPYQFRQNYTDRLSNLCKYLRNQSVWIYFCHMYILVMFKYVFHLQTLSIFELWLIAVLLTITLASLLIALSKTRYFKWLKYLQ